MPTRKSAPKAPGRWEEPPPRTSYDWPGVAAVLRQHPNEWRLIFERDRVAVPNAIRQGSISALRPTRGFEVRTANNKTAAGGRTCSLYLRYVPEKDEEK